MSHRSDDLKIMAINYFNLSLKLICSVLALAAGAADAGSQVGKVKSLHVRNEGLVYVTLEGARVDAPTCATGNYWMIKSEGSLAGRQQYALLLGARLSGARVAITGTHACTRWPDGEDAFEIFLVD